MFETKFEILCAGLGSPAQDRYEHMGASPQKGLEGAGAYVTYLIRSNKGGNKGHNLKYRKFDLKTRSKKGWFNTEIGSPTKLWSHHP